MRRVLLPLLLDLRLAGAAVGLRDAIEDLGHVGAAAPPGRLFYSAERAVVSGEIREREEARRGEVRQVPQVAFLHIVAVGSRGWAVGWRVGVV